MSLQPCDVLAWKRLLDQILWLSPVSFGGETRFSVSDAGNCPTISYTVPSTVSEQLDLLAAATDMLPGDYLKKVDLQFRHILSAIEIKVSDNVAVYSDLRHGYYCKGRCRQSCIRITACQMGPRSVPEHNH